MNPRLLIAVLALTGCPESPSLAVMGQTGLTLPLDQDEVEGEVVILIDGLTAEDLELVDLGQDWFGRAGLRVELVLSEVESGRIDVEPLEPGVDVSRWSNPLLGSRSETYNFRTDREQVPWSEKFLLVRFLEEGDCEADERCVIRLPLKLTRRRGRAQELSAEVRIGLHDTGAHWRVAERDRTSVV